MLNKLKLFLFPALVRGLDINAVDKDGDGLVQEGTPFERRVTVVKKTAKKAPAKKAAAKKVVKKTAKKAPAKKKAAEKKPVSKKNTKNK